MRRKIHFPRLILCTLLVSLCSCSADEAAEGLRAKNIRRVVLISIDTLRADMLGSYGNPAGATVNLDGLAEGGIRFENCIAPSPLTLPSHASLLTGLHPLEHGLLINSQSALSKKIPTLAEILQADGWKTGAVVSSGVLHHRYGLDRGFSHYSDDLFSGVLDHTDANVVTSGDARATTLAAISWISAQPIEERLFLFLHYIDPHAPYSPPAQYARAFPDDPYLGEIAYTDAWIGRLVAFLQEHDMLADTLIVVTSDHGEALGQHGMPTHGYFLYNEVLEVPLIFAGAGLPGGIATHNPVGLIDVVPTLLGLLQLPVPANLPGRDILAGHRPDSAHRTFVSVSYEPALNFGFSPLWSLWSRNEKFVLAPRREYFDTASDPGELENIASSHPERARALEAELRERAAAYLARHRSATPVGLDTATAQQLMALGYAAPPSQADFAPDDFSGRDPKDTRGVILRTDDYHTAVIAGEYEAAEAILDELEAEGPNIPMVNEQRSFLFLLRHQNEELLTWLDQRPDEFRASATQRYHRAVALGRLGRSPEAMTILRQTLAQLPEDAMSRFELANQLTLNDQPEEAIIQYRKLLEIDPRNRAGRLNYAGLVKQLGDRFTAIAELRILTEMHPTYAKAFRNLGLDLASVGDRRSAIAMLQHAIELAPHAANRARTEEIIAQLRARP